MLFRPSRSWHKTGQEMNAPLRLFVRPLGRCSTGALIGCVGVAALLTGCANPFATARVDPNSPVAAEIEQMAKQKRPYPTFADIPPVPTDQRPVAQWGGEANQLEMAASRLDRATAPETWTLQGTEQFATRSRSQAGPNIATDTTTPATEAFARQLRERATPPPPPR